MKKIRGYAAVWDSQTEFGVVGPFIERFRKNAFSKEPKNLAYRNKILSDIIATFNHDKNLILARVHSGTLDLLENDKGLHYSIDPSEARWVQDLVISISRQDINGASFAFSITGDEWERRNGVPLRTITSAVLFEISVVTNPAYKATSAIIEEGL